MREKSTSLPSMNFWNLPFRVLDLPYLGVSQRLELDGRAGGGELVVLEGAAQTAGSVLQLDLHCQQGNVLEIKLNLVEASQGYSFSLRNVHDVHVCAIVWVIYSHHFWKIGSFFKWSFSLEFQSDLFHDVFNIGEQFLVELYKKTINWIIFRIKRPFVFLS